MALRMGRLEGRHCGFGACVKFNLKALYAPILRAERDGLLDLSVLCVSNSGVTVFGDHGAISTVWPLVSYLNSMVSFYRYLFRRLWSIAVYVLRDQSPVRCRSICRWVSGPAPCCFFRSAGLYTAISCQPKDKLTDISVDCVVSMAYRLVRKKERNRKYYACNSEQLKS